MSKHVAIVTALLLVLTYLFIESQSSDQLPRIRMQQSLQAMQLHDAELNRDVLMARAGLLTNYDSLTQARRNLSLDLQILKKESAVIARRAPEMAKKISALEAALDRKLASVEYLKSDNALLRNSLAYFVQSLGTVHEQGNSWGPTMAIAALSHVMLRFVQAPEPATRREAEAVLASVSNLSASSSNFELLTEHGRVIIEVLPRVDSFLEQTLKSTTTGDMQIVQRAIFEYGGKAEARALHFRLLLYLVALILLGYLVYQYRVLRAKARELRWKEIQLIQANKMTALGTLVSGVAHEINNPNQVLLMNAGVVARGWDDAVNLLDSYQQDVGDFSLAGLPYTEARGTFGQLIREVEDSARRIQRILTDLRDFVRPRDKANEPFDLNDVVDRAIRLLGHVIQKRTDAFHLRLAERLPPVKGNPQQIEQVVINLVVNALEALSRRDHAVEVITALDGEQHAVLVEVRDEGVGIPREHISQLGEPFFTTKETSGGTGLGLAITSSLVRSHNGQLTFSSKPGKGTSVVVSLPCSSDDKAGASI
jgi:signal transduction histidine kinase